MIENKLKDLIIERYSSLRQFSKAVNIPYTTLITILQRGVTNASIQNIIKICNELNIDTELLAQGKIEERKNTNISFSLSEQDLIKKYRVLDEHGRKNINDILNNEYDRVTNINYIDNDYIQEQSIEYIDLHTITYNRLSAGTGSELMDADAFVSTTKVIKNKLTSKADFLIQIQGDSMLPKFSDNDYVLVQSTEHLDVGEIGAFFLNDKTYIKKRGINSLISLNKKYKDMPINEYDNFKVIGKVIGKL